MVLDTPVVVVLGLVASVIVVVAVVLVSGLDVVIVTVVSTGLAVVCVPSQGDPFTVTVRSMLAWRVHLTWYTPTALKVWLYCDPPFRMPLSKLSTRPVDV